MSARDKISNGSLPTYKAVGDDQISASKPLELQSWWMITHFLGFFSGGITFILGDAQEYARSRLIV